MKCKEEMEKIKEACKEKNKNNERYRYGTVMAMKTSSR